MRIGNALTTLFNHEQGQTTPRGGISAAKSIAEVGAMKLHNNPPPKKDKKEETFPDPWGVEDDGGMNPTPTCTIM